MFGSQHEALVKTYILVTSQIVLAIELFISGYNLYQEDCRKYSRNLWSNIRFIFFITLFVVAIVSFDWTYKFFSEFEFPLINKENHGRVYTKPWFSFVYRARRHSMNDASLLIRCTFATVKSKSHAN